VTSRNPHQKSGANQDNRNTQFVPDYDYELAVSYNVVQHIGRFFLVANPAGEGHMATAASVNWQEKHEQIGRAAGSCVLVLFGAVG